MATLPPIAAQSTSTTQQQQQLQLQPPTNAAAPTTNLTQPPSQDQSTLPQTALDSTSGLPSCLEKASLRYIRFKCTDLQKTIDFYQGLGLSLVKDYDAPTVRTLVFTLKSTNAEYEQNKMSLVFDYTKDTPDAPREAAWTLDDMNERFSQDYLLVYVRYFQRVIKRLQVKGFKPKINPETYFDIQFAIFTDPNGVEVRIVECSDSQINEMESSSGPTWTTRLGYYVMETEDGDRVVKFYETLFATQSRQTVVAESQEPRLGGRIQMNTYLATLKGGFRVVDVEDVVTGLVHNLYWWLANDVRNKACCLCFTQRALEQQKRRRDTIRPAPFLKGFGFHVPDIAVASDRIKRDFWQFTQVVDKPVGVYDRSTFTRILDVHGVTIELHSKFDDALVDENDEDAPVTVTTAINTATATAITVQATQEAPPPPPNDDETQHDEQLNGQDAQSESEMVVEEEKKTVKFQSMNLDDSLINSHRYQQEGISKALSMWAIRKEPVSSVSPSADNSDEEMNEEFVMVDRKTKSLKDLRR